MACIICVIGIPASGKTRFCVQLEALLKSQNASSTVMIIPYDVLIPSEEEEKLINAAIADASLSQWKSRRQLIVNAVNSLIREFNSSEEKQIDSEEEAVQSIKNHIMQLNGIKNLNKTNLFIIIDDNLYYRSMRYDYYQIARDNQSSFCQIYLKCDVKTALVRNEKRTHLVSESVIKSMVNKLEEPCSQKYAWEANSLTLNASADITNEMTPVYELIHLTMANPVQKPDSKEEMKIYSRTISNTNVIHQVDTLLRKITGQIIKELKSKNLDKNYFQYVNAARMLVLTNIKTGSLILPTEFVHLIESGAILDSSEKLKLFLSERLKQALPKDENVR